MGAKVKEVPLTNRTVRGKLAPAAKPYFRLLAEGLHLGYRRHVGIGAAGAWSARRRRADGGYQNAALADADDLPTVPADGKAVMTFEQAQAAARAWAKAQAEVERMAAEAGMAAPTVRDAVAAYIALRVKRSAKAGADARLRLSRHVLAKPLAETALPMLTDRALLAWRSGLVLGGRKRKGADDAPLAPATEARLLNDLRAALTAAALAHKINLAPVIRAGLKAPEAPGRARDLQILPDADVRRIVEAARAVDPDFGALVLVLAATGARFDQAARITVADFQAQQGRIMVPASRKGRTQKAKPHIAVPVPPDVVAMLRPLIAGRIGSEPLLTRWHNKRIGAKAADGGRAFGVSWEREKRRAWLDSSEVARQWRETLATARLAATLVPYCLRHSSIVRGLSAGLPVRLVAAMHDTSIAMIEAHYSAHIVDASDELLRRAMMPMAPAAVASLAAEKAKREGAA